MRKYLTGLGVTSILLVMNSVGCSSEEGGEGQACFANSTCNPGLECLSDLCVKSNSKNSDGTGGDASEESPVGVDLGACFSCGDQACEVERKACDDASGCSDVLKCSIQCKAGERCDCDVSGLAADGTQAVAAYVVCSTMACQTECTAGAGDGNSSGGSDPGTGGSDPGTGGSDPGTGGSDPGTGGSNPSTGGADPGPCDSVVLATGVPKMIDDFDHDKTPALPLSDGREGSWAHGTWVSPTGLAPTFPFESGSSGPKYLQIACSGASGEEWCNTAWDSLKPWQQWASASTVLRNFTDNEVNCYDADNFTGIRFSARSGQGSDEILLQVVTPDADVDSGEVYKSSTITLDSSWKPISLPFSQIRQPNWSSVAAPLDAKALISISFVVRTVKQFGVTPPLDGEVLKPYDVHIDDVEFY